MSRVPNIYKKAGDGLSDLLKNGVDDKGEPELAEGVTLFNFKAAGDGLVVKEEVGLRAVWAFRPGRNGGNWVPHFVEHGGSAFEIILKYYASVNN